jgi:hypothetical protein
MHLTTFLILTAFLILTILIGFGLLTIYLLIRGGCDE